MEICIVMLVVLFFEYKNVDVVFSTFNINTLITLITALLNLIDLWGYNKNIFIAFMWQ